MRAGGEYMSGLSDATIETFLSRAVDLAVLGAPLNPDGHLPDREGVAAVPDEATAFSHRDARHLFHPIATWADPADDARMIAPTGSATVTATPRRPPGRSRTPMTQPTCSGSTTTSAPVILPRNPYPRSRQMTWLERPAADMLLTMASGAEIPVPSDAELAAKRAKTFSPMVAGHFWRYLVRQFDSAESCKPLEGR
jgi:hypothetical protein